MYAPQGVAARGARRSSAETEQHARGVKSESQPETMRRVLVEDPVQQLVYASGYQVVDSVALLQVIPA